MESGVSALTGERLQALLYFSLRKTGDLREAEELVQDIALAALQGLSNGLEPADFGAWMWGIARNRYADWAEGRASERRRRLPGRGAESGEAATLEVPGPSEVEEEVVAREQRMLMRRELALLAREHREIVVAYYFANRRVADIAASTGLPEGTIKYKLHQARGCLMDGMRMARTYGQRSFAPEDVRFVYSRTQPEGDVPQGLSERLLTKNILLEAYNNPSSAEELALALGIALPYMEDELKRLEEGLLLRQAQAGRYVTDFAILDRKVQEELTGQTAATAKRVADFLLFLACSSAAMFVGVEERSLKGFSYHGPLGAASYTDLVERLGSQMASSHYRDMVDGFRKLVDDAGGTAVTEELTQRYRESLTTWVNETGNRTKTGGLAVEQLLWHQLPKLVDDLTAMALSRMGVSDAHTKTYRGQWDILGLEDTKAPLQYTISRDNQTCPGGALVTYQYDGTPSVPRCHAVGSAEASLLVDIAKGSRSREGMPDYEAEMTEWLVGEGLIADAGGAPGAVGLAVSVPTLFVRGLEKLDDVLSGTPMPETYDAYHSAAEFGLGLRDYALGLVNASIEELIDSHRATLKRYLPPHLVPQLDTVVRATVVQLREHVWTHAYNLGYIAAPEGGVPRTLGMCLYVV